MAIKGAIPMAHGDVWPHGSFMVGEVQAMRDFDRSTKDQAVQAIDRETGELVWTVDVIDADPPALKQLIDVFHKVGGPVLAVERVPREDISSYGVIAPAPNAQLGEGVHQVLDLVEKPPVDEAPSDLAIIGRYVLTPDIFPILAETAPDHRGEIQITDGLRRLRERRPLYAVRFTGRRFDTGDKLGFLKATVDMALTRPDLADAFRSYLKTIL